MWSKLLSALIVVGCVEINYSQVKGCKHATIHVGNGKRIDNAAMVYRGSTIEWIGPMDDYKGDTSVLEDYHNLHVYPGFILTQSYAGLVDIEAVRASNDASETGSYNPNVRSGAAFNAESEIIATLLYNGVMIVQSVPQDGIVSGLSSVFSTMGRSAVKDLIAKDEGMMLHWPAAYSSQEPSKYKNYRESMISNIENLFLESIAWSSTTTGEINLKLQAIKSVLEGRSTLYVDAHHDKEIEEILHFKTRFSIPKVCIVGGSLLQYTAATLAEKGIPLILQRVHRLPHPMSTSDQPYAQPAILFSQGVEVTLAYIGDMEAMGSRNLPFLAGTAAAYGVDYEQAVRMITLNPAKVLGIDRRYGSLEKGKSATFLVSSGDLLDMKTSHVMYRYMDGNLINQDFKQEMVYKKYLDIQK